MANIDLKQLVSTPTYKINLLSFPKPVTYRPFIMAEEENLLMAAQGKDQADIISAMKQLVQNCVLTQGFNVEDIALFDLVYLFLNIRAVSVEENISVKYKCDGVIIKELENGQVEEKPCNYPIDININIHDLKIVEPEGGVQNNIMITDEVGIKMKYPTIRILETGKLTEDGALTFEMIAQCVEAIYDKENIYPASDYSQQDLVEFLKSLSRKQFAKIQKFFESLPQLSHHINVTCPKCGKVHDIELSNVADFFI